MYRTAILGLKRGFCLMAASKSMVYKRPVAHGRILSVVPQNYIRFLSNDVSDKTMSPDKDVRITTNSIHPELQKKWKILFLNFDINGDGVWTDKDFELAKQHLMANVKLTQKQRDEACKMADESWNSLGINRDETMSLDQYLFNMTSLYNSRTLKSLVIAARTRLFYCMDSDFDGLIDVSEFKLFSQIYGHIDDGTLEKAFKAIDVDGDSKICLAEYVDAHVRYSCDETAKYDDLPLFVKIRV